MRSNLKYLLLGLLLGGGITAVLFGARLLSSRAAQETPATERSIATPTAPDTPTLLPLPTFTSLPVASPTDTPSPIPDSRLADQIVSILPDYGGDWNILIRADGARDMVAIKADGRNHIASIIKLPIAMLFFKVIEARGIPTSEYDEYLSTRGEGRTYMQLLTAMLVDSEEDATGTMKDIVYDSKIDVNGLLAEWGAPNTDLGTRHSTPRDIAAIYEALYFGDAITPEGRAILLDLLAAYTPNDDTRLGILRPSLPDGSEFYNKRGSVTSNRLIIGDSVLMAWDANGTRHTYVLVILSYFSDERPTTNIRLEKGIEAIARLFLDFVSLP